MSYRALLLAIGALPLAVTAATFVAGESMEVVVLRTFDQEHIAHDTKLWIVDHEGQPWVRSARPDLGWLERLRANPRVELVRGGVPATYRAVIVDSAEVRRAIDEQMAAKYGWVDRLSGLIVSQDQVAIRLEPDGGPG
jgi:hypothetical protein